MSPERVHRNQESRRRRRRQGDGPPTPPPADSRCAGESPPTARTACPTASTYVALRASASFVNDPSAGSPTETLLRLLLPLDDQVCSTSRILRIGRDRPRETVRGPH